MNDILLELGKFLISTTVLGGLIIWLFKEFMKFRFSQNLDENKAKIDNYFYQEKTKFSKIYDEQALVTKNLYSKLKLLNKSFQQYYFDMKNNIDGSEFSTTINLMNGFNDYFDENRIILDEQICEQIENSIKVQNEVFRQFAIQELQNVSTKDEKKDDMNALKNLIEYEIPKVEKKLEIEFKKILGAIAK